MTHPFTIFIMLRALPAWLALPREQRAGIARSAFTTALKDNTVRMRFFDAEAFNARASDVAVFETDDLQAYYFAIERLRDTPIFAQPYFEIVDIIPSIEDGHQDFEAQQA